jgi:Flp pilus assembly protein TadG
MKILGILLRQATLIVRHRNRSAVMSRACGTIRSRYNRTRAPLFSREDGGALVEFALVMPMFLTLITGMFAFGITMNNYIELTNAVSIGARQIASSSNVGVANPCTGATAIIDAAAANLNSGNISVNYSIGGASAVTSCTNSDLVSTESVKVTATYPCSFLIFSGKIACSLSASSTELIQ